MPFISGCVWGTLPPAPHPQLHRIRGYLCLFPITWTPLSWGKNLPPISGIGNHWFNFYLYKKFPFPRLSGKLPENTLKKHLIFWHNANKRVFPYAYRGGGGGGQGCVRTYLDAFISEQPCTFSFLHSHHFYTCMYIIWASEGVLLCKMSL